MPSFSSFFLPNKVDLARAARFSFEKRVGDFRIDLQSMSGRKGFGNWNRHRCFVKESSKSSKLFVAHPAHYSLCDHLPLCGQTQTPAGMFSGSRSILRGVFSAFHLLSARDGLAAGGRFTKRPRPG